MKELKEDERRGLRLSSHQVVTKEFSMRTLGKRNLTEYYENTKSIVFYESILNMTNSLKSRCFLTGKSLRMSVSTGEEGISIMNMNRNKIIWISLLTAGLSLIAPEVCANFAAPYVQKGNMFMQQLIPICKIMCAIGIVWGLGEVVFAKMGDRPVNWSKFAVILVVSVSLGSLPAIRAFFGV